jgi:hypothetical protein
MNRTYQFITGENFLFFKNDSELFEEQGLDPINITSEEIIGESPNCKMIIAKQSILNF